MEKDICTVDIETDDPGLKTFGCGAVRNYGEILTVAVYCPSWGIDGWYTWEQFQEDEEVLALMADDSVIKVFHNALYDLNWLCLWGDIEINNVADTMTRETLLDAYAHSYSLDSCCTRRGVVGKNKGETIDAWYAGHGGKGKAIEHLKDIPVDIVGKYNLQDVHATYDLYQAQQHLIDAQQLNFVEDIEARLHPWLLRTKKAGMRLNIEGRKALAKQIEAQYEKDKQDFVSKYGDVNTGSYIEMERLFKKLGLPVEYSDTGRPSFTADILKDLEHPIGKEILALRGEEKLLNTYLDGQFVDLAYRGRLHPDLFPALRDEGGTVTGRFSSRNPNGQNISAREEKHGTEVRSLFIPFTKELAHELGYKVLADEYLLGAFDYKQIEYRVFIHFAYGPGVEDVQQKFVAEHGNIDYHQMIQELLGWYYPDDKAKTKAFRHITKNVNFGTLYGLGPRSFAERFKDPLLSAHPGYAGSVFSLAKTILDEVKEKVPFIDSSCKMIQQVATRRGYVKTVSGRRQRLPPDNKVYKMVNYLVQGSAGDIAKKAIVDSWDAGVWDVLIPHMMVHDELVFSIPKCKEGYEACVKLKDCMINAYQLKIPLGVDTEIGPDWGHCDEEHWKEFAQQFV